MSAALHTPRVTMHALPIQLVIQRAILHVTRLVIRHAILHVTPRVTRRVLLEVGIKWYKYLDIPKHSEKKSLKFKIFVTALKTECLYDQRIIFS